MNIYDAIKVLGVEFTEITKEDVKKAYRSASKKYHPDCNPSGAEMMKLINEANEALKDAQYPIVVNESDAYDYGSEINEALNAIIHLGGLIIEVCGSWAWVSGETKTYKDTLKAQGFKFSGSKKMWYFRPQSQKKLWFHKGNLSIDEIRCKYGSQKMKNRQHYALS